MTSLPLNQQKGFYRTSVPEWGTDRLKEKVPLWSAKSPTWHQSGEPIEQFYDLTQLKRSNIRLNDQLMPKPQESALGEQMIHKPFPAEHPYSSHTSRLKVFPPFALTSEDPKRGVSALNTIPLTSETPAAGHDVLIVNKIKGTPDRHEIQSLPQTSLRRGLTWNEGYHHGVKAHGDKLNCYPTPPTTVIPNLMPRDGTDMAMSDRAANTTRNLERQQWKTTYDLHHTGIGPANQHKLDNLADKQNARLRTGQEDDAIYPWFQNTFEPSRPQEGRVSLAQNPNYGVPRLRGAAQEDTGYTRRPTLTEREEYRLLNGAEYISLPANREGEDSQWRDWPSMNHSEERFAALVEKQMRNAPNPMPFKELELDQSTEQKSNYMTELANEHHENIQQAEASNRWKQLEVVNPASDVGVLDRKLEVSTNKEQVSAFYGHEGKYNEERSGLYKTGYEPEKLAYKLDTDPGKLDMRNTVGSATNALQYPTPLNPEVDAFLSNVETDCTRVPMFSDRPDIYEVFDPHQRNRQIRLNQLKPTLPDARARMQEGDVVNRSSTMGSSYNQDKFLQEYALNANARSEPLALMSSQNQNLSNPRVNATKQVKFSDQVMVGEGAGNRPLTVGKANINTPKLVMYSPRTPPSRVVRSLPPPLSQSACDNLGDHNQDFQSMRQSAEVFRSAGNQEGDGGPAAADSQKLFLSQRSLSAPNSLFDSKSSNLGIGATSYNLFKSSYEQQFKQDVNDKPADPRYNWEPGCGVPRPQTSLLKIQNGFSKSAAYQDLRHMFPERNPNLIDNVTKGRKHQFGPMNAQVLRGTLINA